MKFSTSCFAAGLSTRVSRTRRASRGFTMIEMLAVLALAALMIGGVAAMINSTLDDTRAQQAALYQAQLTAAATRLVEQNYTALATQATASTPVVAALTGTTYQLSTFLSNATGATNAYGQTPCLLIYGTATPGALQALLVTEGGSTIPDPALGYAAANAGAGGGSIQATNNAAGAAHGAYGSWSVANPNPAGASCSGTKTATGHLASLIYYNGTQAPNADYLYRVAVPGNPQANTMQVPIVLATQVDYQPCASSGAIAADSAGNVLNCDRARAVWVPEASFHWRDAVNSEADLLNALSPPPQPGDVRMTLQTHRPYVYNGSTWQALAVDEAGNLALGNAQTIGSPCPPSPQNAAIAPASASATLISTDTRGRVLSCQNGTWQAQSEINPLTVSTDSDCAIDVGSSSGSTNFTCGTVPSAPQYDPTMGYWVTVVNRGVPVLPANGAISVYAWAHMQDAYVTSCPSAPQDLSNGQGAYVTLYAQLMDNDTGNTLASAVNQSSKIVGDLANVNLNLTHALPKNNSGYTVRFTTYWIIYGGANPASFQPSYCGTGNNIFYTPGVVTSWTITPFY
ncbi:shufflon system plasmid conjugative transfer pilus tip adhesin PilV [Trinickia diaoshuihuensis]|uniref:shufflon system plasmid conjugative transfer pilus tip adhesin PilV n=1 Tax=Trinickia diaoshuihuensis TaxID=2292265 RepID=UPI001F0868AA|nr:shufflon system plasmid conjugative transfer pilus tip adhesin PilV [Trinickia diaoshuihuensis]